MATLESPEDMERLFKILEHHKGGDGRAAILQPNYIVSNPDYEKIRAGELGLIDLPAFPNKWERGDVVGKALEGVRREVWYPEYHGTLHYDYRAWMRSLKGCDPAALTSLKHDSIALWAVSRRAAFSAEHPYYDTVSELNSHTSVREQRLDIDHGTTVFENLFGRKPTSAIAPAYCWQAKTERIYARQNIRVIQGKDRQNCPVGWIRRIKNKIRKMSGVSAIPVPSMGAVHQRLGIRYLRRNVDFEPVIGQGANQAYTSIQQAWTRNEPAIVSCHRVNFVNQDSWVLDRSLSEFESLLDQLAREHPETVFVTDTEIDQLYSSGSSVLHIGDHFRIRNYGTQTAKMYADIPSSHRVKECVEAGTRKPVTITSSQKEQRLCIEVPSGDFDLLLEKAQ